MRACIAKTLIDPYTPTGHAASIMHCFNYTGTCQGLQAPHALDALHTAGLLEALDY